MPKTDRVVDGEYAFTKITPHMTVTGDIISQDNILVEGRVFGNVSTTADLTSSNLIVGNLKANSVALNGARLKGCIDLEGNLSIGEATIIVGDIHADSIKVAGKVKGNMNAEDSALLTSTALISGDIEAGYVTTEAGARINGSIVTRREDSETDLESEFDLGDLGGEED